MLRHPRQGSQVAMAAKIVTEILCFKEYKHLVKNTESPALMEGYGFIQNEKQPYFHENAKLVGGRL